MTLERVNKQLERMMPVITPLGIVMGFLLPGFFILLRPLISWFFAAITLSGALKLKARDLGGVLKRPLPIALFFFTAHVVMPAAAFLFSSLVFHGDTDTISGYVLLYSAPTAVSGFIWVSIFRGDPALSLALILLDTIAAPLVMPGTVSLLVGTKITMDFTGMALSLVFMVVAPTVAGVLLNETSGGKIPSLVCPYLNPLAKILLSLVIAANASAVAHQVHIDDPKIWIIAIFCILFSALGFFCAKLIGVLGKLNESRRAALFFAAGLRNITAATTIAIDYFPPAAAFPAILGIVFQQSLAAIMGKLLMKKGG
ncbi:Na+-dependent transporter [Spirochaetia bacterium]|nr:Na+-dependent transporter [Spirochaetia bacterium]